MTDATAKSANQSESANRAVQLLEEALSLEEQCTRRPSKLVEYRVMHRYCRMVLWDLLNDILQGEGHDLERPAGMERDDD